MFARLFAVASLAALAVASPALIALRQECSTGSIQCCENVQSTENAKAAFAKLGLDHLLADVDGPFVGATCSPYSLVGVGSSGGNCAQSPICCNGNTFDGLLSIGCSPISAWL